MCVFMLLSMYAQAYGEEKRKLELLELKFQAIVRSPTWVPGAKLGPLEEQYAFLSTEPSL